jgi:hypothetical protein
VPGHATFSGNWSRSFRFGRISAPTARGRFRHCSKKGATPVSLQTSRNVRTDLRGGTGPPLAETSLGWTPEVIYVAFRKLGDFVGRSTQKGIPQVGNKVISVQRVCGPGARSTKGPSFRRTSEPTFVGRISAGVGASLKPILSFNTTSTYCSCLTQSRVFSTSLESRGDAERCIT